MSEQSTPKHRARPSLVTKHRERVAASEHHMWSAQGLERPMRRGRHAADTRRQAEAMAR